MTELPLLSAFAIGLAGAGHCAGMCGGIAAALQLGGAGGTATTLSYHGGRILSYTLLGGLLGFASGSIDVLGCTIALRYLAGFLLISMGLYIGNWWRGMMLLEQAGAKLWQPVQGLASRWLPVKHWYQALPLGLCWGLMPCGLIYSSLAFSATAGSGPGAALMMLCFGLGTLPAMLAAGLGAGKIQLFLKKRSLKSVIAVLLIGSGVWTLYITYAHSGHPGATGASEMNHSGMHPG